MILTNFLQKIAYRLLDIIELQLVLTASSLPILVCWGLPISLLTLIGNIVFTPFLALFLGLSTVLFSCAVIDFSPPLIPQLLNHLTDCWYFCMSFAHNQTLIYIPQPYILLLPIPLCSIGYIYTHNASRHSQIIRITSLCMTLLGTILIWHISCPKKAIQLQRSSIVYSSEGLIVDYAGSAPRNVPSWIRYTLIPECARNFGSCTVEHMHLKNITPSMLEFTKLCIEELKPRQLSYRFVATKKLQITWEELVASYGYIKKEGRWYRPSL